MDQIIVGVLGIVTVQTGRIVIWLISLGQWRGETPFGDEGRIYGGAGALSFVRDGKRVITDTGLLFVGIVFYAVLIVFLLAVTVSA